MRRVPIGKIPRLFFLIILEALSVSRGRTESFPPFRADFQPDWVARQRRQIERLERQSEEIRVYKDQIENIAFYAQQGSYPVEVKKKEIRSFWTYDVLIGTPDGVKNIHFSAGKGAPPEDIEAAWQKALTKKISRQSSAASVSWQADLEQLDFDSLSRARSLARTGTDAWPLGLSVRAHQQPIGVAIVKILAGSPAASTLRVADVITRIEQRPITTPRHFAEVIQSFQEGSLLKLEILRAPEATRRTVTLRLSRPSSTWSSSFLTWVRSDEAKDQFAVLTHQQNDVKEEIRRMKTTTPEAFARANLPYVKIETTMETTVLPGGNRSVKKKGLIVRTVEDQYFISANSRAHALKDIEALRTRYEQYTTLNGGSPAPLIESLREAYAYLVNLSDEEFQAIVKRLTQEHGGDFGETPIPEP